MYTVIKSEDPYLLARFSTELMMEGFIKYADNSPFMIGYQHLAVYNDNYFNFLSHHGQANAKQITLTEKNYLETLAFLIKHKRISI